MHHCTKSTNDRLSFYENSKRVKAEYYLSKYPATNTDRDCQTVAQRLRRLAELKNQLYNNQDDERIGQCQTQLDQCNERVRQLESQTQEFQQQCQTEKQILEAGKNDIQALYDGLVQESQQNKEVRENLQHSLEEAVAQQTSLQSELGEIKKVSGEFIKDIERLNKESKENKKVSGEFIKDIERLNKESKENKKVSGEFIKDIERLNKERKTRQTEISDLINTRDTLISAASISDMEMKYLRSELAARQETIARIQLEKDELDDEIKKLNESAKRGEIDLQTLNEQLAAIRVDMGDLQKEHDGKVQELNSLREKYVQLQETSQTTAKQSGLNQQRAEELSAQFKECEEKREELVRSLESVNIKLEGQTQTSLNVQTEWNNAAGKVNALNLAIAEKEMDYIALEKQHTAAQQELIAVKKEREDALLELRSGLGERNELRENLRLKNDEVGKCRDEVDSINALLIQERDQLKQVKTELESEQFEKDELQKKLEGMKITNENVQKEWTTATGKVNLLTALVKSKSDEYQKSLEALEQKVLSITAELDKAKDDCQKEISQISQKCQTEKDDLNAKIGKLQAELQESNARNDAMTTRLKELTSVHADCQKTLDASKLDAQRLREAFEKDLADKDGELTATKSALSKEKSDIEQLYQKLRAEFDSQEKIVETLRRDKMESVKQLGEVQELSNKARAEAERLLNELTAQISTLEARIQKNANMTVDERIAELRTKIQFYKQYNDATKAKLQEILNDFPKKVVATSASRATLRV
jgi:chromosome segregation ATPase